MAICMVLYKWSVGYSYGTVQIVCLPLDKVQKVWMTKNPSQGLNAGPGLDLQPAAATCVKFYGVAISMILHQS